MRTFSQISYHERQQIYTGISRQMSIRQIGKLIGKDHSAVSREIARNGDKYGYLYPGIAQELTNDRKNVNKQKIDRYPKLKEFIVEKLKMKWSPKMISEQLRNDNAETQISAESIYSWLYISNELEKTELRQCLIRKRKKRGLKPKKSKSTIKNRVSVHDRPKIINDRSEAGHYECDLMFNRGSQSQNVVTFIERVTRKVHLIRNDEKSTKTVINKLIKLIDEQELIAKSITFDNGTEFADHIRLKECDIDTYFCDPGSPWQKGSVEHCNGMLRRFLPFDLAAQEITEEYVIKAANMINQMPRQILNFKNPSQVFNEIFKTKKLSVSRVKIAKPATEAILFSKEILSVAFHS